MFNFLKVKKEAFGLDISDLSLKVAKLKKKGKYFSLASWGEFPLKDGIMKEGEIKDKKALIENIKKALAKVEGEKIRTDNVVVSLPEKKAFLQIIPMPKMKEEELKKAVPFEAENYIPLPIEKAYIDFQLAGNNIDSKRMEVLIAAISKDTVESYFECLKEAGLNPRAFEIESQSIARAVVGKKKSEAPLLIIDFGKSNTSFIIFSGSSIKFTSSSSVSSRALTEAVAKELKIEEKEAEKMKIKYGLGGGSKKVSKALTPALKELAGEADKYRNYYKTHSNENSPEISKILICGRGGNLKGLADVISSKLNIPVEKANPWINILPHPLKEIPELSYEDSLGYTTALGLALRGVKGNIL